MPGEPYVAIVRPHLSNVSTKHLVTMSFLSYNPYIIDELRQYDSLVRAQMVLQYNIPQVNCERSMSLTDVIIV